MNFASMWGKLNGSAPVVRRGLVNKSAARNMQTKAQVMRRILLVVTAINLAGMACMWASAQAGTPMRSPDEMVPSAPYLIESVGYALMLPGIFFASATLLLARVFGWNEGTTCAVWYFSAGFINVLLARSTGDGLSGV
jgi:hypothetical protein